ncbi:MAG: agmatine deiminase family protein [Planctomycetia bacterium]
MTDSLFGRDAESPRSLGYRMPAEWEPQAATWLALPHNPRTWRDRVDGARAAILRMAAEISTEQHVHLVVPSEEWKSKATEKVAELGGNVDKLTLHHLATDDAWLRDSGPTFVVKPGEPAAVVAWRFNAWGGKYPPFDADAAFSREVGRLLGRRTFTPDVVMEGGSIEVNGSGTVLTTEECLLNPNRNPHLTRADLEQLLAEALATPNVVWLTGEVVGDDTDGHVDNLARFVAQRTIAAPVCDDPADPNYRCLAENWTRLTHARDEGGRKFELVRLPTPTPVFDGENRLPASYANFLILNHKVLVPVFDVATDALALELLAKIFPTRRVVGVYARDLVFGSGAVHCLSQQEPAGG